MGGVWKVFRTWKENMIINEEIGEKINSELSLQEQRIEKNKEIRNIQYKELDKKIERADNLLKNDISLLKHQPILGMYIGNIKTDEELQTVLRVIEKTNERDNNKNQEIFDMLDSIYRTYTQGLVAPPPEIVEELDKEYCNVLESTRGFCYLKNSNDSEVKNTTIWRKFKDEKLRELSDWGIPERLFDKIDNIKRDYSLSDSETGNLFVNALMSNNLDGFFKCANYEPFWEKVNNKYILRDKHNNMFDDIFSKNIMTQHSYQDVEILLCKGKIDKIDNLNILETLRNLYNNNLYKTTSALMLSLCLGKLTYKNEITIDEQIQFLEDRTSRIVNDAFQKEMDILTQSILLKSDDKEKINEIQKELKQDYINGDINSRKAWDKIKKITEEKKIIDISNNPDLIFDSQIIDFELYNRTDFEGTLEMNVAMAVMIPKCLKEFYSKYKDDEEFTELYFENGGDLDAYSENFRENRL